MIIAESPMLTYKFDYKLVKRNNEDYLQVTKSDLKHTTTRLRINFENLFNGDKALGKSKLINSLVFFFVFYVEKTICHYFFFFR